MAIAEGIKQSIENSSWIRKMFEEGARLKSQFGGSNVYDFSLGNPDLEPPDSFFETLNRLTSANLRGIHGYMPNAGYDIVREKISRIVTRISGTDIPPENIIMSCGAAGGLNSVLKTILNPGDEVIVSKPYFVEYNSYISNHGGKIVLAKSSPDFSLDTAAIEGLIGPRTRAVLINSPNNPTGRVYSENNVRRLCAMLKNSGQDIYLISDEPYREIVYDGATVPGILRLYDNSIMVYSYSKSLSIPGERIGYVAVNPRCSDAGLLLSGIILSTRILGYVNAPALMQRIVAELGDVLVDVAAYKRRRDIFIEGLGSAGYDLTPPEGAFYIFCKSPIEDDVSFIRHLQKYNILAVPGSGFGGPGYFRLAYCVPEDMIERSIPKFRLALEEL